MSELNPLVEDPGAASRLPSAAPPKDYKISPEIRAGFGPGMDTVAEHLRRTYGWTKHGAMGASDLTSQLANRLKYMYGSDKLRDASDQEIVDDYRKFHYGDANPEESLAAMQKSLLPDYKPEESKGPLGGLISSVGDMVAETFGAPAVAVNAVVGSLVSQHRLSSIAAKIKRMQAAGLGEGSPEYRQLLSDYQKEIDALHGRTQMVVPASALTGALVGTEFLAAPAEAIFAKPTTNLAVKLATKVAPKLAEPAAKWIIAPSIREGTRFAAWETTKYGLMGQFSEIPEHAWEGFKSGLFMGPVLHVGGVGLGKVKSKVLTAWGDAHPNAATLALQNGGEKILDAIKNDTKSAINDFKIDLTGDIAAQADQIAKRLFGENLNMSTARNEFVKNLTSHLEEFKSSNPEFKPDWQAPQPGQSGAGGTPSAGAGPVKVDANTPTEQLNEEFVGPDGKTYRVRNVRSLTFLINRYKLVSETENPQLKEALFREILRRRENNWPENLEKPSWRKPAEATAEVPAAAKDPHELPPDFGSKPEDVFFNPDVPAVERTTSSGPNAATVGGPEPWTPTPRWDVHTDGELYPSRAETLRDRIIRAARALLGQVEEDKDFVPIAAREHPGWGELHTETGPDAAKRMEAAAAALNEQHGPGTAEVVYATDNSASLRVNKDLENWHLGGRVGPYRPHFLDTTGKIPMTRERALAIMKQILRAQGWGDERVAVADPSGRIYMTDINEYAEHLLEAAAEHGPQRTPEMIRAARDRWLQVADEVAAREEEVSRRAAAIAAPYEGVRAPRTGLLPAALQPPLRQGAGPVEPWRWNERAEAAAPPKESPTPQPPPDTPHGRFVNTLGAPVLAKNGAVIVGKRIFAGRQIPVRLNSDGTATVIGNVGGNIPDTQLRAILMHADTHGVPIERHINATPENKTKIEELLKLGFKAVGFKDGATVFVREPAAPGTLTLAQAEKLAQGNPTVATRIAGLKPEDARIAAGNVSPGEPALQPVDPNQLTFSFNGDNPVGTREAPSPPPQGPSVAIDASSAAAAPPAPAPAARDMGGRQIAIRLHTPAGAKKSDVLKLFGEKAKGLNFLLRKEGDGWVVVFDPKKVRAHMQGVGALTEMGIPEEAMQAGGWWNPKEKKWELQDMYNENAPAAPAAAVQTAPGQNALLGPQHFEFARNQVKEAYDKLPPIDEISSDNFVEAVSPLTTAVQRMYSVAKDAKMLPTLMADHDFKNRISLVISAHEVAGKPLPPDIVELNNKLVQYHKEQWALRNKK